MGTLITVLVVVVIFVVIFWLIPKMTMFPPDSHKMIQTIVAIIAIVYLLLLLFGKAPGVPL